MPPLLLCNRSWVSYLVLELCDRGTLEAAIRRGLLKQQPSPPPGQGLLHHAAHLALGQGAGLHSPSPSPAGYVNLQHFLHVAKEGEKQGQKSGLLMQACRGSGAWLRALPASSSQLIIAT